MNKGNTNIKQDKDEEEQRRVKQLNQEIMFVLAELLLVFLISRPIISTILRYCVNYNI